MSSQTQAFLHLLNDRELSFLYKYKYSTSAASVQNIIELEMKSRNLDEHRRGMYIREYEFSQENKGCIRCNSSIELSMNIKSYLENDYTNLSTPDTAARAGKLECAVCGYMISHAPGAHRKNVFRKIIDRLRTE